MLAISAANLQWQQGARWRLAPMDLKLTAGQIVTLVGANGAGKTTLLEVLSPLAHGQGQVSYFGQPRETWCRQQLARHVTMMPALAPLHFPLRVEDVVHLGTLPWVGHASHKQHWTQKQLAHHGLKAWRHRLYTELSTGEQQRVQLARVLLQLQQASERALLLLDEPTAHLDPQQQHQVFNLLRQQVQQTGLTVVLSCHDINLAIQYSDQLIGIAQQRLLAVGSPAVLLNPNFIEQLYGCDVDLCPHPRTGKPQVFTRLRTTAAVNHSPCQPKP